jgi:hypothetical protein
MRRDCQACRPATDDQDVDLRRHGDGGRPRVRGCWGDAGVAGPEAVEMELHGCAARFLAGAGAGARMIS